MSCGCKNRRGGQKVLHRTRDAAIKALAGRRYADGLPHSVYECPKVPGRFHIRTERAR